MIEENEGLESNRVVPHRTTASRVGFAERCWFVLILIGMLTFDIIATIHPNPFIWAFLLLLFVLIVVWSICIGFRLESFGIGIALATAIFTLAWSLFIFASFLQAEAKITTRSISAADKRF